MKSGNSSPGNLGFCDLLTVLFVGLKLAGFIDWSWLWVLSPIWLNLVIWAILVLIVTVGDS